MNQNQIILKKEDEELTQKLGLDMTTEKTAPKEGVFDIDKVKSMAIEIADNWNIPTCMIAFIANSLDQNYAGRVLPWKFYRK